jgi:DNA invertase Pin-like site-specific DNA recombinase
MTTRATANRRLPATIPACYAFEISLRRALTALSPSCDPLRKRASRRPKWAHAPIRFDGPPWAKGKRLSTTVAFLAETQGSASIEEQKARFQPDDQLVLAGRRGFDKLTELLAHHGLHLGPGDRIKVYDLSCIALSTTTLIRVLAKMLRAGISFEIVSAGIVLEPTAGNELHALLNALDGHSRHVHGIKTHPADTAPQGRKRLLDPKQLPDIRAKLEKAGATATDVALELGVARSTLFNYLERYDRDRRLNRTEKAEQRGSEHIRDDGHVVESDEVQGSA